MAESKKKSIAGEYTITENPIDGRLVAVHFKDGSMAVIRK